MNRKLYWTEDGASGNGRARLAQANLDGSGLSTLYGDLVRPTGLAIAFGLKEDRYGREQLIVANCTCTHCFGRVAEPAIFIVFFIFLLMRQLLYCTLNTRVHVIVM